MKTPLLISAALLLVGGAARAQDAAPPATSAAAPAAAPAPAAASGGMATMGAEDNASLFGVQGQMAITDDLQLTLLHESVSKGGSSSTGLALDPSLDYFVVPNVSVGGTLIIEHAGSSDSSGSLTSIGLGVRGGYALRLANLISFWPQLQLAYVHESLSAGGMDVSGYDIRLGIFAPFLFHPAAHFFVGIGPLFQTDLVSKLDGMAQGKTTDIGLQSVVGGYFGP